MTITGLVAMATLVAHLLIWAHGRIDRRYNVEMVRIWRRYKQQCAESERRFEERRREIDREFQENIERFRVASGLSAPKAPTKPN